MKRLNQVLTSNRLCGWNLGCVSGRVVKCERLPEACHVWIRADSGSAFREEAPRLAGCGATFTGSFAKSLDGIRYADLLLAGGTFAPNAFIEEENRPIAFDVDAVTYISFSEAKGLRNSASAVFETLAQERLGNGFEDYIFGWVSTRPEYARQVVNRVDFAVSTPITMLLTSKGEQPRFVKCTFSGRGLSVGACLEIGDEVTVTG